MYTYFIDTHCHLLHCVLQDKLAESPIDLFTANFFAQQPLFTAIFNKAIEHNVKTVIEVGCTLTESRAGIALAHYLPIYASVGLHPYEANTKNKSALIAEIQDLARLLEENSDKIVAIGECGLDNSRGTAHTHNQEFLLHAQLELATHYKKPLIIHSRDAAEQTYQLLKKYSPYNLHGVIHCYSYDSMYAQKFIDLGFYLGIGGSATYPKNNSIQQAIKTVGVDAIVLETDAPFLAPQIIRGTPNEPANIPLIADFIARMLHISLEELTHKTTHNAINIFHL